MPRFFFSVRRDGSLIFDHEGDELPDANAAQALAHDILNDMRRLPHIYGEPREWRKDELVISDESGAIILVVPFGGPVG